MVTLKQYLIPGEIRPM